MSKERAVVLRTMAEVAAQMVAQGDWQDEALAAEASALAHRLNEEARAIEAPRTPETVLRAMLKAYEAAALDAEVAYARDSRAVPALRPMLLCACVGEVRLMLAHVLANKTIDGRATCGTRREVWTDYEARMSGASPLDAPPMEEP